MGQELVRQFRQSGPILAACYLPTLAFLAAITVASFYTNTPLAEFTRDPAYTTGAHPLLGVASNLGVLSCNFAFNSVASANRSRSA